MYSFIAESGCWKLTSHLEICSYHRFLSKLHSSAQKGASLHRAITFTELEFISGWSKSIIITLEEISMAYFKWG